MRTPSIAEHMLNHWGVPFECLPEGADKQADFMVNLGVSKFLIEEKAKFDSPEEIDKRMRKLAANQLYSSVRPLVRTSGMSKIVSKAVAQLDSSSKKYPHDFRLVWITGTGPSAKAYYHEFIATLYGTTRIVEMNSSSMRTCYFFRNSEFYKYADSLDGAVVGHLSSQGGLSVRLCLNPLSAKFPRLLRTKFAKLFGTAIENPVKSERSRIAYILDSDTDRKNENGLLQELQLKYATRPLMQMDMGFQTVAVTV